ncbi:hypothetical protein AB4027_05815 [Alkalibacterium putridalgicola]|uniref:hypothetical protein n=1 Tax=Alkalibacterium putridalgicola TaxID=426703 RepID=UPI0034CF4FF6
MTHHLRYLALTGALLTLAGCGTDEDVSKIQIEPISLLRIKDGSDETEAPRHIQIRPEQKKVSVFDGFDDTDEDVDGFEDFENDEGYENHELVTYDVSDETIDISYDNRSLSLTDIDNRQYEDEEGNIYQMEFYTENYEDD